MASDAQLFLSAAVLLDATGQLQAAAAEYQRAFDANAPDPVILRRWASLRLDRRQLFSAAVAARQLAVWAMTQAQAANPVVVSNALSEARELCAAVEAATFARSVIDEARALGSEFPEELEVFLLRAQEAQKLAMAKLRDAELAMLSEKASSRTCGDDTIRSRLDDSVRQRVAAVSELKVKPVAESALLFDVLRTRDPSPEVRAAVTSSRAE